VTIAVLIVAADLAAFAGSYLALYQWAANHGLAGWRAWVFPIMIDTLIAAGELGLFVSLASGWPRRTRIGAMAVTVLGLVASVAGNVGHAATADWATRLTFAAPPLVAFIVLAVGLTVLKWTAADHRARVPAAVPVAKPHRVRGQGRIKQELGVGQGKARQVQDMIRAEVRAASNGHTGGGD
jgi:hypothetical protein